MPCVVTTNATKSLEETKITTDTVDSTISMTEVEIINEMIESMIDDFLGNQTKSDNGVNQVTQTSNSFKIPLKSRHEMNELTTETICSGNKTLETPKSSRTPIEPECIIENISQDFILDLVDEELRGVAKQSAQMLSSMSVVSSESLFKKSSKQSNRSDKAEIDSGYDS